MIGIRTPRSHSWEGGQRIQNSLAIGIGTPWNPDDGMGGNPELACRPTEEHHEILMMGWVNPELACG